MIDNITLEYVCDRAAELPCAPDLVPKLMRAIDDPNANDSDLAALIARDAGTAASVLRLANSASLRRTKSESINDAILRIGRGEVYKIVSNGLVRQWLSTPASADGWDPTETYNHSCAVAIAAEILAKDIGIDQQIAYTAGLLHAIGKLGMAHSCGQHFAMLRKLQSESSKSWRELESDVFGFDHTEVGAALLRQWLFHPSLVQVVEFYPRPRDAWASKELVLVVHAAKNIVLSLGLDINDGFQYDLDAELLSEAGYTQEYIDEVVPRIERALKKANLTD